MNVDNVERIIYNDSTGTGNNIIEVWRGGAVPILLWPKNKEDFDHYEIRNITIHYHNDRTGADHNYIGASGSLDDYAYATGDVRAYRSNGTYRLLRNVQLTPISIGNGNTYTDVDGVTERTFLYINGKNVYVNNLRNNPFSSPTGVLVNWAYEPVTFNTNTISEYVLVGPNQSSTKIVEVTTGLSLNTINEHTSFPAVENTINVETHETYDVYRKDVWTSGFSSSYTRISQNNDRIVIPTTFNVEDSNGNTFEYHWNEFLDTETITLTANESSVEKIITISATYIGKNIDENSVEFSATLEITQAQGYYTFGDVSIDTFYYASFDLEGELNHGSIIPAYGNINNPIYPFICTFSQTYSWSGSSNIVGTLRGSATSSTVTLSDENVTRTYSINYSNATNQSTGAVEVISKNKNTDSVDVIEVGYNSVKTVTLTVSDVTDGTTHSSDSKSANVYQQANAKTETRNFIGTKKYYIELHNFTTDDYLDNIPTSGVKANVYCHRDINVSVVETWTAYPNDSTAINTYNAVDVTPLIYCTSFSISPSSGYSYNTSAHWIQFNENQSLNSITYTISSVYTENGTDFPASISLIQHQGSYTFSNITINDFYYASFELDGELKNGSIIPARGNIGSAIEPVVCTFSQTFGWNGRTSGVGSFHGSASSSTVTLTDSNTNITRTYTVNYTNANSSGHVEVDSKGQNTDSASDIRTGWTIVKIVTLTVSDNLGNSDSKDANIYQEANECITTYGSWSTYNYNLILYRNTTDDIIEDHISSSETDGYVKSYKSLRRSLHYTWTSGAEADGVGITTTSPEYCTTFTVTGTGIYTHNTGSYNITFHENRTLSSKTFVISDTYTDSDGTFPASIEILQAAGQYVYDNPVIDTFVISNYNKEEDIVPITGTIGNLEIKLLTFYQDYYINYIDSNHKIDTFRGSVDGTYTTSGIATDSIGNKTNFTISYSGTILDDSVSININNNGSVTVGCRPYEDYKDGIIKIAEIYATVTCNYKNSDSESADVYQYQNYITYNEDIYTSYDIEIVIPEHYDKGDVPPRDITNNNKPFVYLEGTKYFYNHKRYASMSNSDPDVVASEPIEIFSIPESITATKISGIGLNPNYNTSTGALEFDENQSLDEVNYKVTGTASYSGINKTSSEKSVIITEGDYSYGNIENLSISYDRSKDENGEANIWYNIAASGNWNNGLFPVISYSQTYGWNGRTSGVGTSTSGAELSFSGGVEDSDKTEFNRSTGEIRTKSLGFITTYSLTTVVSSVSVTAHLNGSTDSAYYGDVTQQINESECWDSSLWFNIDSDYLVSSSGTNFVFKAEDLYNVPSSKSCTRKYSYTSYNFSRESGKYNEVTSSSDISGRFVKLQNESYVSDNPEWISFSSSNWTFDVLENELSSNRSPVIFEVTDNILGTKNYYNISQGAAVFIFEAISPVTFTIDDTDINFDIEVLSKRNNRAFAITSENISFQGTNSLVASLRNIDNVGDGHYSINFSCSSNGTYNSRSSTIRITQPTSGINLDFTVSQRPLTPPSITISRYTIITGTVGVTISNATSWDIESVTTWDYENETSDESNYISYTKYDDRLTIDNNILPNNRVVRIVFVVSRNNIYNRAHLLVVPNCYISYGSDVVNISSSANNNVSRITSTYPNNIGSNGTDGWLTWDGLTLTASVNNSSNQRRDTASMTGSIEIEAQNEYAAYSNSDSAVIEVIQEGHTIQDSILINGNSNLNWNYQLGDNTNYNISIASSGAWTCSYDDEYFVVKVGNTIIESDSTVSTASSCTVTIKKNGNGEQFVIAFYCGTASATLTVETE